MRTKLFSKHLRFPKFVHLVLVTNITSPIVNLLNKIQTQSLRNEKTPKSKHGILTPIKRSEKF